MNQVRLKVGTSQEPLGWQLEFLRQIVACFVLFSECDFSAVVTGCKPVEICFGDIFKHVGRREPNKCYYQ